MQRLPSLLIKFHEARLSSLTGYFLNIYKEKNITSFDVVRQLRKILNTKKIGHSGTLDPLAHGVMQVAVGSATRLLEYLDSDKTYIADIKFGYVTDTLDAEGEKEFIALPSFDKKMLEETLAKFVGNISQIPPKFSAIKIGGKKLCDLARANKEIPDIKPRLISIYKIELLNFNGTDEAKILVECSSGTYIRSLVRDIGEKLNCGAYMSDLIRIKCGNFLLENSQKISPNADFTRLDAIDVLNLNKYALNFEQYQKVLNGNPLNVNLQKPNDKPFMLIYDNKLVSVANLSDNVLKMEKVFKSE